MMNRRSFLNPHDNTLVEKIGRFIDELRPLDGERAADEGEVLARILARDKNESDRRLRLEILRTVGDVNHLRYQRALIRRIFVKLFSGRRGRRVQG